MTEPVPVIGMFIQWTNPEGALSEPSTVPNGADKLADALVALRALVPEGCRAAVIGVKLGKAITPWFYSTPALDAAEVADEWIANGPLRPTLFTV